MPKIPEGVRNRDRLASLHKVDVVYWKSMQAGRYFVTLMVYRDVATVHVQEQFQYRSHYRSYSSGEIIATYFKHVYWSKISIAEGYGLFETMKTAALLDLIPAVTTQGN